MLHPISGKRAPLEYQEAKLLILRCLWPLP